MATGMHPWYTIITTDELLKQINNNNLPCIPADIYPEIVDILRLCFNYDIKKRPSAEELLNHKFFKQFFFN